MSTQINKLKGKELADVEKRLYEYSGDDRVVSSIDLAKDLEDTKDLSILVATGIPTLDRLHEGGFEPGELIIVTGPSGEGKTTLMMSMTKNMAEKNIPSIWFSLEVTPRQFLKKITKSGGTLPLFYLPNENSDNQIKWLEERIIEAKVKYNTKVVFIDHIHQIFSMARMNPNANISFEIGDLVGKIKNIALSLNLIIFLVAHTKDDPSGSARDPRKEDIRDSGLIQRLADSIIGVWRVPNDDEITSTRRKVIEENDAKAKVRVFKNRRVGLMSTWFMYHSDHYLEEQIKGIQDANYFLI